MPYTTDSFCCVCANRCGTNEPVCFLPVIACLKFRRVIVVLFCKLSLKDDFWRDHLRHGVIPSTCCWFGKSHSADFPWCVFYAWGGGERSRSQVFPPRRRAARLWLQALRATEIWVVFISRATTSETAELRRLRLNACLLVLGNERQFGGLMWQEGWSSRGSGWSLCEKGKLWGNVAGRMFHSFLRYLPTQQFELFDKCSHRLCHLLLQLLEG